MYRRVVAYEYITNRLECSDVGWICLGMLDMAVPTKNDWLVYY